MRSNASTGKSCQVEACENCDRDVHQDSRFHAWRFTHECNNRDCSQMSCEAAIMRMASGKVSHSSLNTRDARSSGVSVGRIGQAF